MKRKLIIVLTLLTLILSFTACGKNEITTSDTIEDNVEDTDVNIEQREKLFEHIGQDIEQFNILKSQTINDNLYQWWYGTDNDETSCVYVAIGDVAKNNGGGFAEFENVIPVLSGDEEYLLEIAIGSLTDDGYLDMDKDVRSYYFIQEKDDLIFMELKINE